MAVTSSWGRFCTLTIAGSKVSGSSNLTNFPVLITHNDLPNEVLDSDIATAPKSDGGDIRFTSDPSGATELAFEIVHFTQNSNPALATVEIHVKVPSISFNSDTNIYMWWDNSGASAYSATDTYGRNNVWSDYVFVSHNGGANDSTGNYTMSRSGTISSTTNHLGVSGRARQFDAGTVEYYYTSLGVSYDLGGDYWSVTAWAKNVASDRSGRIIVMHTLAPDEMLGLAQAGSGESSDGFTSIGSGSTSATGTYISASSGNWHYVRALHADSGGVAVDTGIQVDGGTQSTTTSSGTWSTGTALDQLRIGARTDDAADFGGDLSEIRIWRNASAQYSNDAYITEYNNQVDDGTFWSASTPTDNISFPTDWSRRVKITVDNTKVSGSTNLTNFPILLNEDILPSEVLDAVDSNAPNADGSDIRFSSDRFGTTQLAFEIVHFTQATNPANGTAEIWVKIPTLSYNSDTDIYMWWGQANAEPYTAVETYGRNAVWADYELVSHNPADLIDSTGNLSLTETGTGITTTTNHLGVSGRATTFDDTTAACIYSDYIPVAQFVSSWTIQCALNKETGSGTSEAAVVLGDNSEDGGDYIAIGQNVNGTSNVEFIEYNGTTETVAFLSASDSTWYNMWAGTDPITAGGPDINLIRANNITFFNQTSSPTYALGAGNPSISRVTIGNHHTITNNTNAFGGSLAEVRVRNSNIGSDWAATEYNNFNTPSTFASSETPTDAAYDPTSFSVSGSATVSGVGQRTSSAVFPTEWRRYCSITIDNTKVSGSTNLTNFPVLITHNDLPDEVMDSTDPNRPKSDGADIRFTSDAEGTTELAFEIVHYTQAASATAGWQTEIWVKIPTVTYNTDTVIYMWWDCETAIDYLPTDTYGRNAVWSDYFFVSHDGGRTDATGNYTMTETGTVGTTTNHLGVAGKAANFDTNVEYFQTALADTTDLQNYWSISFWGNKTSATNGRVIQLHTASPDETICIIANSDSIPVTGWLCFAASGADAADYVASSDSAWHYVRGRSYGATVPIDDGIQVDGGAISSSSGGNWGTGTAADNLTIGCRNDANSAADYVGALSEVRIYYDASAHVSNDWYLTEWNNQQDDGTFWTAGTPTDNAVSTDADASGSATTDIKTVKVIPTVASATTSSTASAVSAYRNATAFAIAGTTTIVPVADGWPAYIKLSDSTYISASGENTTAQLTPPSGKSVTANFGGGRIQDDENPGDAVALSADEYREDEWAIIATTLSAENDIYNFRVLVDGKTVDLVSVNMYFDITAVTYEERDADATGTSAVDFKAAEVNLTAFAVNGTSTADADTVWIDTTIFAVDGTSTADANTAWYDATIIDVSGISTATALTSWIDSASFATSASSTTDGNTAFVDSFAYSVNGTSTADALTAWLDTATFDINGTSTTDGVTTLTWAISFAINGVATVDFNTSGNVPTDFTVSGSATTNLLNAWIDKADYTIDGTSTADGLAAWIDGATFDESGTSTADGVTEQLGAANFAAAGSATINVETIAIWDVVGQSIAEATTSADSGWFDLATATAAASSSVSFDTAGIQETDANAAGISSILFLANEIYEFEGYRYRNDDGDESTATWKEPQDTTTTIPLDTIVRIRTLLNVSGDPGSAQVTLQYKKSTEDASYWRNV